MSSNPLKYRILWAARARRVHYKRRSGVRPSPRCDGVAASPNDGAGGSFADALTIATRRLSCDKADGGRTGSE